jgi:glycosyltransferase involved in cell wall biosynthesis
MKVLWFHPRALLPPRGGGDLRTLGLINLAAADGHEVLLVEAGVGDEPPDASFRVIHLDEHAGLPRRARQLVSRHPLRAPRVTPFALEHARSASDEFTPQVAVISEVMSAATAFQLIPSGCPWIYDAHNVEHELFRSHRRNAESPIEWLTYAVDAARVRRDEMRLVRGANSVVSVSEMDAEALRRIPGSAPVTVVPNSVSPVATAADPAAAPPTVLFVGTLHYPPNVAAVTELVETVMPRVHSRVPDARLLVVGRGPVPRVRELLAAAPWASLEADLPTLDPAYQSARCVAVPMRLGSGTNIKIFEAMAHGVPVVATPKAVEGIPVEAGSELLVERDPAAFADAVASLLLDSKMAGSLGCAARAAFTEKLAWDVAAAGALRVALDRASSDSPSAQT